MLARMQLEGLWLLLLTCPECQDSRPGTLLTPCACLQLRSTPDSFSQSMHVRDSCSVRRRTLWLLSPCAWTRQAPPASATAPRAPGQPGLSERQHRPCAREQTGACHGPPPYCVHVGSSVRCGHAVGVLRLPALSLSCARRLPMESHMRDGGPVCVSGEDRLKRRQWPGHCQGTARSAHLHVVLVAVC